jgi:predicted MFS family arabinose efflux permease
MDEETTSRQEHSQDAATDADAAPLGAGFTTSARGWAVMLLFRFQESTAGLTSLAFGFFLPFIKDDLGITPVQAGWLQLANGIPPVVLAVPFTAVFSRFRPVSLIFWASLVAIPFVVLQAFAVNFVTLFIPRLLFSVFRTTEAPARTLLLQQWASRKHYALVNAIGLSQHSVLLAAAFSTIAIIVGAVGSWRTAFFILSGALLAELLVWRSIAREDRAPVQALARALRGPMPNPLSILRRYPQLVLLGIVSYQLGVMWIGMVTFLPTVMKEERHISLAFSGPLVAFLYFGIIPTAVFGDWIGRHVPNRKVLLTVTALANTACGLAITLTPNPWLLMAFMFALGAVWAPFPAIQVLPFDFPGIQPREVAMAVSLMGTLGGLGFATGALITGYAAEVTGSLVSGLLAMSVFTGTGVIAGLLYPSGRTKARVATLSA